MYTLGSYKPHSLFVVTFLIASLSTDMAFGQSNYDSLEWHLKEMAKPGRDQLDLAIGLARSYTFNNKPKAALAKIDYVRQIGKDNSILEAEAYALILESLIAYEHESDFDKAIKYCKKAMKIAAKHGATNAYLYAGYQLAENYSDEKGEVQKGIEVLQSLIPHLKGDIAPKYRGDVFRNIGIQYAMKGNATLGIDYLTKALDVYKHDMEKPRIDPDIGRISSFMASNHTCIYNTLEYLGHAYFLEGDYDKAILYKNEALEYTKHNGSENALAAMYDNLADLYMQLGNFDAALELLQESRKIFERLNHKQDLAHSTDLMIDALIGFGSFNEAEKHIIENLKFYRPLGDTLSVFSLLIKQMDIYSTTNNILNAEKILPKLEVLAARIDDDRDLGSYHVSKGCLFMQKGDYKNAISCFTRSLSLFENMGFVPHIVDAQYQLASAYKHIGKMDSALYFGHISLDKAKSLNHSSMMQKGYHLLSTIYDANQEPLRAYEFFKKFHEIRDSIYTNTAQRVLQQERVRQNVVKFQKEKDMAESNATLLKRQNQIYVVLSIFAAFVLLVIVWLYLNLRKVKGKLEVQNLELNQLNKTKDKFFGIIAHDLKSPLVGLQGVGAQVDYFLRKGETQRLEKVSQSISDTTKSLNELLDNLLNWALLQDGMIPYNPNKVDMRVIVDSTFQILNQLAEIKNVKLLNQISENSFVYADEKAVSTVLRNLISNALKFTDSGGQVLVDIKDSGNRFTILVNDSGTGISAEQLPKIFSLETESKAGTIGEKGTGLGLVLCKELIELNQGSIDVKSQEGVGSTFTFDLPKVA